MSYKVEKKNTEAVVKITLPWKDVQVEFDKLVKEASKTVAIKGFRKGHVPTDLAEKQVDKALVLSQVAEKMLNTEYGEVMQKENFRLAGMPEVSITKLAVDNDIEATIKIALIPEIELPKDWKKKVAKINKEFADKKVKVTKDQVDEEVKKIAQSRVKHQEVDREAKKDDHVKVDFTVKRDGVVIENGTSKDHSLVLGKGVFIPGFEEEVMGMKKGESKSFTLTFPEKYHAKHLAGKKADFEVTLNKVEERITPEINDEFVQSLGEKFKGKTLSDFQKQLEEGMIEEQKKKNNEDKNKQYLDIIIEDLKIALPESLVKSELQRMISEFSSQISMSGMDFEQYLQMVKKTTDDLEKEWRVDAEKRVKSAMILEKLAEVLEVEISAKEIEEELNKTLSYYKGVKDIDKNIDMKHLYDVTKGILTNQKVLKELSEVK